MNRYEITKENNKLLEKACIEGDLNTVIKLTTSPEYEGLVELTHRFNCPLRSASVCGKLNVIDFLVNFPDEEIKKEITYPEEIKSIIKSSLEYAQNESFFYFKKHFPEQCKEFLNEGEHNSIIDILIIKGKLETIKLFMEELPPQSEFKYPVFIKNSIQHDKMDCFNYFLSRAELDNFKKEEVCEIIHMALYHERFECLKKLMNHSNLIFKKNLNNMNSNDFQILLEFKFDSLKHIVFNYDYQPNKKLRNSIENYLEKKDNTSLTKYLLNFMDVLEKHQFKKKLDEEIEIKSQENKPFKRKI